jgi:DNA polymerase bacteriophage-type
MANKILWLDFETKSRLTIKVNGLDRYSTDPSTAALMLAWAVDDGEVNLWLPHLEPKMPLELQVILADPDVLVGAWNYNFERRIMKEKYAIDIPIHRWIDPSVLAGYMALPIALKKCGRALEIEEAKIETVEVSTFSRPSKMTKKMLKAGVTPEFYNEDGDPMYFKNWETHPEKWAEFCEYCKQDVRAEREIYAVLQTYKSPLTDDERLAWELDQRMNERGVYIDMDFVNHAKDIALAEVSQIVYEMKFITHLENPNSQQQMIGWMKEHGYPYDSIDQEHIEAAVEHGYGKGKALGQILALKVKLGGSAYKKLQTILDRVGIDGQLRYQFLYHGAHTGRWSGRGVQLQNLYKPSSAIIWPKSKQLDMLTRAIREGKKIYTKRSMMDIVASCIRSSFAAQPGNILLVGDLAQIESRVLAAIAQCMSMIEAYKNGHDLYKEFMSWLLSKPVEEITGDERTQGKVVILGSGFGMGPDKFRDYALTFGVELSEKQAQEAIYGFREKYPEIPALWKALNNGTITAVKANIPVYINGMVFDGSDPAMFKIKLPSGRYLHYFHPYIALEEDKFGRMRENVCYTSFGQKGEQISRLYGGLLTENVVQAVARDILLNGMLEAEKAGMPIIMTIHDEIAAEVAKASGKTHKDLLDAMRLEPWWATGMGLVLAAEGYENAYYKK